MTYTNTANPERLARDYQGHMREMPTPKGYTLSGAWEDGIVELWSRYTSSGTMYACVYGLQIETGLDRGRATRRIGEALLHAAECEGRVVA